MHKTKTQNTLIQNHTAEINLIRSGYSKVICYYSETTLSLNKALVIKIIVN